MEREKRRAAEAAVELVQDGMIIGLGTGSTAAYLLEPLAARKVDIRCVATSPSTAQAARAMGIDVVSFAGLEGPTRLDMVIDGADQVDPSGWLIKGGGGAHTREKAVAATTDRFVVIVSANKLVERLTPPVPLELAEFGLAGTLARLGGVELRGATVAQMGLVKLRDASHSPDGGVIADFMTPFEDPRKLAEFLSEMPGVVEHGLFPPSMVSEVLVGRGKQVERIPVAH
ncbi:MAG TPA: ribose 5-phosphate isomerase A [Solirubrobacteraceae bacterium]|nr:ribose 5-phosphate isomerase A [Solirubrobacteraceae bacterium]